MNVLANDNELLKYTESLFSKKFNKKGFYSKPAYNNEYIKTRISSHNENFQGNKRLTKDKYYGHSILLEFICEVKNKYYPQTFLGRLFERSNVSSLFKELVQIVDWSDDECNDKSYN